MLSGKEASCLTKKTFRGRRNPRRSGSSSFKDPCERPRGCKKALPIDELGYRRVGALLHDDARAYYVYGVLDEVMKASMAGMRWLDLERT